ncbi:MAG: hypothetical protein ACLU38_15180 [Dysosmobacter sp.]
MAVKKECRRVMAEGPKGDYTKCSHRRQERVEEQEQCGQAVEWSRRYSRYSNKDNGIIQESGGGCKRGGLQIPTGVVKYCGK